MKWNLPKTPYKVFANIPFNKTTEIIRKLTNDINPPDETWLVIQKGAAKRFIGKPDESLSSLTIKPFFDSEIIYYFRREDFHPAPSVDVVLLHFIKKSEPDVETADRYLYNRFLSENFYRSGEMLYVQWLGLFRRWLKHNRK